MKPSHIALPALLAGLLLLAGACNSKTQEEKFYTPSSLTAVTSFSLKADSKVLENLDSVFFSIDLNRRVIYNADSLPAGTPVDALVAVIKYSDTVSGASIEMQGGKKGDATIDYKKNPTDTIDFSGRVTLTLTAEDGLASNTYLVKVNVHEMVADSIVWDQTACTPLPSRSGSPKSQKTVQLGQTAYSLICEADGELTLSISTDLTSGKWQKAAAQLPFVPSIATFCAGDDSLFILDDNGRLWTSTDALTWTPTEAFFDNLAGGYGSSVIGITRSGSQTSTHLYPGGQSWPMPDSFPIEGFSNMNVITTQWMTSPTAVMAGGRLPDGSLSGATWAFDGKAWALLSQGILPAAEGITVFPYFSYRKTAALWIQTQYSVLMALGGRLADGSLSRDVYISYDNGVAWKRASDLAQLPAFIPSAFGADVVLIDVPMQGDVAADASRAPMRLQYELDGSTIKWDCPYIYIVGGYGADSLLLNTIWRGVLSRLSFMPII